MSLKPCRECGREISNQAKQCPQCGATPPKQVGVLGIIFAGALGLAAFQCSSPSKYASREISTQSPAVTKEKAESDQRYKAARNAIRKLKKTLKDPDSLDIDTIAVNKDGSITCIIFRAKNSFNAKTLEGFVYNGETGSSNSAHIKKLCDAKKNDFFDTTFAK